MKHYPRIILVPVTTILCIRLVSRVPDAEQYNEKSQTKLRIKRTTQSYVLCIFLFSAIVYFLLIFVCISFSYCGLRLVCLDPGEQAFYTLKCPTLCCYRIQTTLCPPFIFGGRGRGCLVFSNSFHVIFLPVLVYGIWN